MSVHKSKGLEFPVCFVVGLGKAINVSDTRELPLSRIHLRNIEECADNGCAIVPPMLTFYNGSNSLEQQIDHIIGKILMQFGIEYQKFVAWQGEDICRQ